MGKKKDKKNKGGTGSEFFDYRYGVGEAGHLMDRYGVEGAASYHPDGRSGGKTGMRSDKDVKDDIAKAMMNDYDTRRSLEAAAMAGDKDAKKFAKKGIKGKNIQDAYGVLRDLKKEYVGGGGMDGAKNRAGLTQALVQADRDAQTAAYKDMFASKSDLEKQQENAEPVATDIGYSYNDYMKGTFGDPEEKAQSLLADSVKNLSDSGATEEAKAKQGQYVLKNLGADTYQS